MRSVKEYMAALYWMRTNSYPVALLKVLAVLSEGWLFALSQKQLGANVSVKGGPAAKRHFTNFTTGEGDRYDIDRGDSQW